MSVQVIKRPAKPASKLKIEYVAVEKLQPDPDNARRHTALQIRQIGNSIKAFTFGAPIIVRGDYQIVSGHARAAAAQDIGMAQVPVVRMEHLTTAQARGLALAENQLATQSRWDDKLLALNLKSLAELDLDFEIEATGFSMGEIDLRIEGLNEPAVDPDDDPAPSGPSVARVGDLWRLGDHRIYCGDARKAESYGILLQGEKVKAVFADPPYDVKIVGHVSTKRGQQHREFVMGSGELGEAFPNFLADVLGQLAQHSTPGSVHFICMDWRHLGDLITVGRQSLGTLLNICVWVKPTAGMGSLYRSRHELITVWRNGPAKHVNNVELGRHGRDRTNVWEYPGYIGMSRGEDADLALQHPSPKPVQLIADALLDVTKRGDTMLDPFLGSGAALLGAERVGRVCRGMELDPLYVDLSIRRWMRMTGGDAVLANTGQAFSDLEKAPRA